MHIIKAVAKNWMKLKTVDCVFENGVIKVTGKNAAGKSTILQMVESLGGKKKLPEVPLKKGEKKGKTEITLGEGNDEMYKVSWSLTQKSSYLRVEAADGSDIGNPQELLNSFLSKLVDPWLFVRMATGSPADRKKAYEILKSLMSVEFNAVEYLDILGYTEDEHMRSIVSQYSDDPFAVFKELEAALMENRLRWKKALVEAEATAEGLSKEIPHEMLKSKPVDMRELMQEQAKLKDLEAQHQRAKDQIANVEHNMDRLKKEMEALASVLETARRNAATLPPISDNVTAELEEKLRAAQEQNQWASKIDQMQQAKDTAKSHDGRVDALTDDIEAVRDAKTKLLESAKMPVDNLSIADGKIMLNELPFEQASSREQLVASIDVGMAKKPKLNVFVCRDASLLDKEGEEVINEKAKQYGAQVFLEIVRDEAEPGVVFVDNEEAVNV